MMIWRMVLVTLFTAFAAPGRVEQWQMEECARWQSTPPGICAEFLPGVLTKVDTDRKLLVLTFDACGGRNGNGVNRALLRELHKNNVPATLFLTARWIKANPALAESLAADSLFDIQNHGLNHKPATVSGREVYHIPGCASVAELVEEVEGGALAVQDLTGHKPQFYRSGTAYYEETALKVISDLDCRAVNYSILPGDAIPGTSREKLEENFMNQLHPGGIVLMHMNHPESHTAKALARLLPRLKKKGWTFSTLNRESRHLR